jgi:hypothetical protein
MKAPKPKAFDPVPKGSHVARLYQIIHLGTTHFEYKGEAKSSNKIRLTFELCNERKVFTEGEEAKPYSISREFGWNMSPRGKLRPFIEGMLGVALDDDEAYNIDIESLLGEACLVTVVHEEKNGNTYANILNASPLPKGMEAPATYNPTVFLSVEDATEEQILALPEFLRDKLYQSDEWAERMERKANPDPKDYRPNGVKKTLEHAEKAADEVDEADIPF